MRKSRLSQHKQNKLIELFVAGVTARTAAELVNVNKNIAAFYFHRLRLLIYQDSPHLEMFGAKLKRTKAIWVVAEKANEGVKQPAKSLYLGFSSEMARFIPLLCRMLNLRPCSLL